MHPLSTAPNLDAHILIVHGAALIADNSESDEAMCAQIERWFQAQYPATPQLH